MNQENSQIEGAFEEWQEFLNKFTEALNTLAVILEKFVKTFCNAILLFALKTMNADAKRVLKLNAYQSALRRKVALRELTLSLTK